MCICMMLCFCWGNDGSICTAGRLEAPVGVQSGVFPCMEQEAQSIPAAAGAVTASAAAGAVGARRTEEMGVEQVEAVEL